MSVAELLEDPSVELYRWTADEFMAAIEAGAIREPRRVELLDGIIERTMPQGPLHRFSYAALNRVLSAMGVFERGMESIPPVILGERSAIEPDFGLLRPEAAGRLATPREGDLLWAVEVSDATLVKDLGRKKRAYARASIPHYWVVDAQRRGVWAFSEPVRDAYTQERFVPAGTPIELPVLGGTLDTTALFPSSDAGMQDE